MRATPLGRAVRLVCGLNLAYFLVEVVVAWRIGSISLFADSVDFLEDAAVNFLIFAALGWSLRQRARVGMALSALLLLPAGAFVWALLHKLAAPAPPEPLGLSLTGAGALAVNLGCAFVLARFRDHSGSLTKAAFLSARNDAIANLAIIAAGVVTVFWASVWPDVVVGVGIALMNLDAAREVWAAARQERRSAEA